MVSTCRGQVESHCAKRMGQVNTEMPRKLTRLGRQSEVKTRNRFLVSFWSTNDVRNAFLLCGHMPFNGNKEP